MTATENSGVFDTGTFDNAEFDTIEQPSSVNVFSTENTTFNLSVQSFAFVFSDLGKEIRQDLTSFVSTVNSTIDAQKQILRTVESFADIFSTNDFKLGKKAVSTVNVVSNNLRIISITRNPVSFANVFSKQRIIFELVRKSMVNVFSNNISERIFTVKSSVNVFSQIKDILRTAPELTPPFTVDVPSFRTFTEVKQSFKTFVEDKT